MFKLAIAGLGWWGKVIINRLSTSKNIKIVFLIDPKPNSDAVKLAANKKIPIFDNFEETLLNSNNVPEKISILRLDTDFYESTKMELEVLFPRLEKNGILIIDDYGFKYGARKAVDEYFKEKPFLIYVDHDCRLLIKN